MESISASTLASKTATLLESSKPVMDKFRSPSDHPSEGSGLSWSSESEDSSSESDRSTDPFGYDPDFPAVTHFTLFPKLPNLVQQRVWKFCFPNARVVDIVYDKEQDKYHCFSAEAPAILHACKESRQVGLGVYSICFGTVTHAAAIPFDFEDDCLLFDDWLATSSLSNVQTSDQFDSVCAAQMCALIGPMGLKETKSIHRLAIPGDFFTVFRVPEFSKALEVLVDRFKSVDYLILALEDRSPYDKGPVLFSELSLDQECCCATCLLKYYIGVSIAIKTATERAKVEKYGPVPKFHIRRVYRGAEQIAMGSWISFCDCGSGIGEQYKVERGLIHPDSVWENEDDSSEDGSDDEGDDEGNDDGDEDSGAEASEVEDNYKPKIDDLDEGELDGLLQDNATLDRLFGCWWNVHRY